MKYVIAIIFGLTTLLSQAQSGIKFEVHLNKTLMASGIILEDVAYYTDESGTREIELDIDHEGRTITLYTEEGRPFASTYSHDYTEINLECQCYIGYFTRIRATHSREHLTLYIYQ